MQTHYDIVVIGGGPVGLSFACSLLETNIKVLLVEKSSLETIARPQPDGREIALTHLSINILKQIGVWDLLDHTQVSALKHAKVFDGDSPSLLNFSPHKSIDALGYLIANVQIRQALYTRLSTADNIEIITSTAVDDVVSQATGSQVVLDNGSTVTTRLVIAADSRFSNIRRQMGIPSLMKDFSKVMIVAKMQHELPHDNAALEYFDYGKTLALLPMVGNASSVVLTVKTNQSQAVLDMDEAGFNAFITDAFKGQFGAMQQVGERHAYPLVAVHAQRFIGKRFALIGDAAVGMHPVTAHGFNLGLRGQDILATLIKKAHRFGEDIGSNILLNDFEKRHIHLTRLMFFGTNGIVALFTNDAPVIKPVRKMVLKLAEHFPPIKALISHHLSASKQPKFLPF